MLNSFSFSSASVLYGEKWPHNSFLEIEHGKAGPFKISFYLVKDLAHSSLVILSVHMAIS